MVAETLKIYKVSTPKNYVWVAAYSPNKAREYAFNALDDAWLPEALKLVLHSDAPKQIRVPGVIPHTTVVRVITPETAKAA